MCKPAGRVFSSTIMSAGISRYVLHIIPKVILQFFVTVIPHSQLISASEADPDPIPRCSASSTKPRCSYLSGLLRSPIGMIQGKVMRFEIDPPGFQRLRSVIGQANRLTVSKQGEVSRVKDGLPALLKGFGCADAPAASPGPP